MDKETAKRLSVLIADAASTIEALLETTDEERSQIAAEAQGVADQLRALDGQLVDEIFAAAMRARRP